MITSALNSQNVCSEIDENADVADSRRERSLTAGVDLEDPPQLALGDAPPQLTHCWIEPLDVADGEELVRSPRRLHQCASFFERVGDRLLHQDVKASLESGNSNFTIAAGGNRDDQCVEPPLGQHLAPRSKTRDPVLLADGGHRLGILIGDRTELRSDKLAEDA